MARVCSVCMHPERGLIDHAVVAGTPVRDIAGRFSLSKSAVARHRATCLPQVIVRAIEEHALDHAIDVAKQLRAINAITLTILLEARLQGNHQTQLKAIDRVQRQIELESKLLQSAHEQKSNKFEWWTPEFYGLLADLEKALEDYPEAMDAIVRQFTDTPSEEPVTRPCENDPTRLGERYSNYGEPPPHE